MAWPLLAVALLVGPALGQEPGWHYSPLPGEGDRATLGCDRDATTTEFTCLAVRCEDDFSTGIYVHSGRGRDAGTWEMTLDRENASLTAEPAGAPYGARFVNEADWLLERLQQGSFVYLRNAEDSEGPFRFIDLSGSLAAIHGALAFCAPRVPASVEPKPPSDVT